MRSNSDSYDKIPLREPKKRKVRPSCACHMGNVPVSREELAFVSQAKRALGLSWREAIYRGLGLSRQDFINSHANRPERRKFGK